MPDTRSRTRMATSQELVAQIVTAASDAADARDTMDATVQRLWKSLSDTYGEDLPTNANRSKAFRKFVMEEIPDDAIRRVLEVSFKTSFMKNKELVLLRQATEAFSLETWAIIYLSFGHRIAASRKSLRALNKLKADYSDATFDNVADVAEDKRKLRLGSKYRPGFRPPMQLADINATVAFFHGRQNLDDVAETDESESNGEEETGDEDEIGNEEEIDKEASNEEAQDNEPDVGVIDPTADGPKDRVENIEAKAPPQPIIGCRTNKTSGAGSKLTIDLRPSWQQDLQLANDFDIDRDDAVHPETGRGGNRIHQGPESQEDLLLDDLSSQILPDASSFESSRLPKSTNDEDTEFGERFFEANDHPRTPSPVPVAPQTTSDATSINGNNRRSSWLQSARSMLGFQQSAAANDSPTSPAQTTAMEARVGKRNIEEELFGERPKRRKAERLGPGSSDGPDDAPPAWVMEPPPVTDIIDLRRLKTGKWLNDEIVNRAIELAMAASLSSSVFIDSWLHSSSCEKSPVNSIKLRESPHADILTPVNESNSHWFLLQIRRPQKIATMYDSLGESAGTAAKAQKCLEQLRRLFPDDIAQDMTLEWGVCAKQPNGYDCGVATVANAIFLVSGVQPVLDMPWNV
ncbi:sentrin/SUMO-specific protease [Colletotrichum asianum]